METVDLDHHDWTVSLAPRLGGSVLSCAYKGQHILRETPPQGNLSPVDTACFPLVPFSNRVGGGTFSFDGQEVSLPANTEADPSPVHGSGWIRPWDIVDKNSQTCRLRYDHAAGDWPWAFRAEQDVSINENGVTIKISLQNMDNSPMPSGLGLHPYFPSLETASITFNSLGVWKCGDDCLPTRWTETPQEWNFKAAKPLRGLSINNCFTGWDGRADILWTDRTYGAQINAGQEAGFAVVYTNLRDNYVCFEPASHMNNGLNWEDSEYETGVKTLAPGEMMDIIMHITALKTRN